MQWIGNLVEKQNLGLDFRQISNDFAFCENLKILAEKKVAGYVAERAPMELIFGAMDTEFRREAESELRFS